MSLKDKYTELKPSYERNSALKAQDKNESGQRVEKIVYTLSSQQYKKLEDRFPMRGDLDAIQTAVQLGQQMVLKALREGFVTT